jgi:hypothetical protein
MLGSTKNNPGHGPELFSKEKLFFPFLFFSRCFHHALDGKALCRLSGTRCALARVYSFYHSLKYTLFFALFKCWHPYESRAIFRSNSATIATSAVIWD